MANEITNNADGISWTNDKFSDDPELILEDHENYYTFVSCRLGSFELASSTVDEAHEDCRDLLELWQLKDSSLTCVQASVIQHETGLIAEYTIYADRIVEGLEFPDEGDE